MCQLIEFIWIIDDQDMFFKKLLLMILQFSLQQKTADVLRKYICCYKNRDFESL